MQDRKLRNYDILTSQSLTYNDPERGFTLIEVITTLAVVSISLVMVMQLFSSGLKSSRTTCNYTRAVVHAKDKMEELFQNPEPESGEFDDGFQWETEVQPYEDHEVILEDTDYNILELKVKISWSNSKDSGKSFELISLKTVSEGEDEED